VTKEATVKSPQEIQEVCKQCQKCCRWEGYVYVSEFRLGEIARYLELSEREVARKYCDLDENRKLVLKSRPNHDCVFIKKEGCQIYPVRPMQCRNFPKKWTLDEGAEDCPLVRDGVLKAKDSDSQ